MGGRGGAPLGGRGLLVTKFLGKTVTGPPSVVYSYLNPFISTFTKHFAEYSNSSLVNLYLNKYKNGNFRI